MESVIAPVKAAIDWKYLLKLLAGFIVLSALNYYTTDANGNTILFSPVAWFKNKFGGN